MSYDAACYELAKSFLSDDPELNTERRREKLAQTIQDSIEAWIEQEGWEVGRD